MKSPFATALAALFLASHGLAGQADAQLAQVKPKTAPAAADGSSRPKLQTPAETAKAMPESERLSIQSDLAWTGYYNGLINGEVSDRMIAAIKAFQKAHRSKETGVLNPQERSVLIEAARRPQANVGWKIVTDMVTGARVGLPLKLVPNTSSDANGSKWSSSTGTIVISLDRRKQAGATSAAIAGTEKKAEARRLEYSAVKPDFFVLSGTQGLKKFYIRGETKNSEVRLLTILYDQALEGIMNSVTVAMSSAFVPFPAGATPAAPRNMIEYSTGIIVSADGAILADRLAVDSCSSILVAGHDNADKIAKDETSDLALLRIYGVSDLRPLPINEAAIPSSLVATGISDPQLQNGSDMVTSVNVTVSAGEVLTPAPPLGFSGAALTGSAGTFAGMAKLRPVLSAGPAASVATGTLVPANAVMAFLRANNVTPATGAADPKISVARLICVRK
ncbi:MAG: peptidoglycan-binding protein [Xanthobacteraceae bacterium]|nr:peptidoglycan-binding protein [Xanthobacteraceae bacterium]